MKSGLLWYDKSSAYMEEKIKAAAKRYRDKFGILPNVAFVNPQDIENEKPKVSGIKITTKTSIMPNHIWLGIGE